MGRPVLRTPLCELLGIEYPIVLAGMGSRGKATPAELVAAVSAAGGLGVIGGSGLPPEELRAVIRHVRKLTNKPIGVDLLLPAKLAEAPPTRSAVRAELQQKFPEHHAFMRRLMQQYALPDAVVENDMVVSAATGKGGKTLHEQQVAVVLSEDVQVFAAGLGDPSWVVPMARARGVRVMGLAGNLRNAQRQVKAGVDIVVSQGYEAGGHTGSIANFALIPQVVDAVDPIPVVAGGGIADGRGVAAALALGAIGAWVGTAFLVADECQIPERSKNEIVRGGSEDFAISRVYTGKTMRAYKNEVIEAWSKAGLQPLPMPYQKILMDDFNEAAAQVERWDLRSNPGGQIAALVTATAPAQAIFDALLASTIETLDRLSSVVRSR